MQKELLLKQEGLEKIEDEGIKERFEQAERILGGDNIGVNNNYSFSAND